MNDRAKFDLDLKMGQQFEQKVANICNGTTKIEVKSEIGHWHRTGNMAFERKFKGKPSGLDITESAFWIHCFVFENKLTGFVAFPVERLKARLSYLNGLGRVKIIMGGDRNDSEIWLVRMEDIKELLNIDPFFG